MAKPKFKSSDIVELVHGHGTAPRGTYEIVRLIPSEGGEPRYRIRSLQETHERVALEHELRAFLAR